MFHVDSQDGKAGKAMSRSPKVQKRTEAVLALTAAGLTKDQIAKELGMGTTAVQAHRKRAKEAIAKVVDSDALQARLESKILELYPIDRNAADWVELATKAKMETVRHGAKVEINKIIGIVPLIERIRAKSSASPEPQPMFVLPPGCNLALTINQQNNTISSHDTPTCSELQSLHNTPNVTRDADTTIGGSSQSADDTSSIDNE